MNERYLAIAEIGAVRSTNTNFLQYYDLEAYLFNVVAVRYTKNKTLTAFDFFCIVIWKANRAKSKVRGTAPGRQ